MLFLEKPPRYFFFTGKGGVGKTSIACATAVQLADRGQKVLLVSTDPASNVGQVFNLSIGNRVTPITTVPSLSALEIDPLAAAKAYRERIVGPARGVLPESIVKEIEEQLSGACTTEIAAFDEFTELLTPSSLTQGFDHIIFDTAPTGHTIRLLQLPGAWTQFLDTGKGDASCLGPLSALQKQRSQYRAAVDALSDPQKTRLVLVARAQAAALREAARTHEELAGIGLSEQHLIINGVLSRDDIGQDSLAAAVYARETEALKKMPAALKALPHEEINLKPFNLVSLEALRQLLSDPIPNHTPHTKKSNPTAPQAPSLSRLIDEMTQEGHGLVMLMGKGGVGKTTIASAIALALAQRGYPVHLSTSDPAAHLTETLDTTVDQLKVSRIDPNAVTERYRQEILATKGALLDANGRAMLEEDLRSPCTEEIAVFQAFSHIIQEAREKFVIMDTAPTGHTLLLLDATGAYHREMTRQTSRDDVPMITPLTQLQDPKQTKILIITLAETTPVLEAANLQADLRRAGIEPWAWIINHSLSACEPTSPLLQQRAHNELREIDAVATEHAKRYALIPLMEDEPTGLERLLALCDNGLKTP